VIAFIIVSAARRSAGSSGHDAPEATQPGSSTHP
jgi:hypothetical protein